jgi:hypothetical protein
MQHARICMKSFSLVHYGTSVGTGFVLFAHCPLNLNSIRRYQVGYRRFSNCRNQKNLNYSIQSCYISSGKIGAATRGKKDVHLILMLN